MAGDGRWSKLNCLFSRNCVLHNYWVRRPTTPLHRYLWLKCIEICVHLKWGHIHYHLVFTPAQTIMCLTSILYCRSLCSNRTCWQNCEVGSGWSTQPFLFSFCHQTPFTQTALDNLPISHPISSSWLAQSLLLKFSLDETSCSGEYSRHHIE